MNTEEIKRASEVMRRASLGEMAESTLRNSALKWGVHFLPHWDWNECDFRILDFPEPPEGQKWHNPPGLTATQVGVHEGWRLLLDCELDSRVRHDLERFCDGKWLSTPKELFPNPNGVYGLRTKSPLPEVKSDPIKEAWERIVRMKLNCSTHETAEAFFRLGWHNAEEHQMNQKENYEGQ